MGLWKDLKDRLDMRATNLQLEQQQNLCIARLLPLKPEIILMDEPCSALDVEGTRAIEELMFELRGRYTIVIVTHNMAQARRASDECIFMLLGELIEHSRTEDLFLTPKNPKRRIILRADTVSKNRPPARVACSAIESNYAAEAAAFGFFAFGSLFFALEVSQAAFAFNHFVGLCSHKGSLLCHAVAFVWRGMMASRVVRFNSYLLLALVASCAVGCKSMKRKTQRRSACTRR